MAYGTLLACGLVSVATIATTSVARAGDAEAACAGDCDGNGSVTVSELVQGITVLVGSALVSRCEPMDANDDGEVRINELVLAVANALGGCACPLDAAAYTLTLEDGGMIRVGTLSPFPLPPGGLTVDVGAGSRPGCAHQAVVPFPGGFQLPTFCIPATGFSISIVQTGCGVGLIDSNGGSDFTVTELGDTSDSSPTCNLPNPGCPPGPPSSDTFDEALRVDVGIGDGTPDGCSAGTANALVTVPVRTTIWRDTSGQGYWCPAEDGTYDPPDDTLILQFSQTLDLTTDGTSADWVDLGGDGCLRVGGPNIQFSATGACMDLIARRITLVASGTSADAGPLRDVTFVASFPGTFGDPEPSLDASCDSPPLIDFTGTVNRCVASSSAEE